MKFNIFGGFQKNKYFWGIKILWIFFLGGGGGGGITELDYFLRSFLCILGFFQGQCTEWEYFLGVAKISNIFLGYDWYS